MKITKAWELVDLITLSYIKSSNSKVIIKIIDSYNSLQDFVDDGGLFKYFNNIEELYHNPLEEAKNFANQQLEICSNNQINILTIWDENYPVSLINIDYPPPILFYKGILQSADQNVISIVGTRKNTVYGKLVTEDFASFFANHNIIVCSGLAFGIDTIAHLTTIANHGITYAVIASGLDNYYTGITAKNANKILESGGAVFSEYKCGVVARPGYFPQRNRIISGLAKAVIVIECAEKSGALITAKFAFNQGREVFAVPGNINTEKSKGTNLLIKNDYASPALSPEQVLLDLNLISSDKLNFEKVEIIFDSPQEKIVYDNLNFEPKHIDTILQETGLDISELLVSLLNLEFRNLVKQLPGKYYLLQK
ncbi:MAG TPA: DNA-processing protein DprA [Candidatus Kapabacteria bacterium]|nr:DNA-processing protein DprA [Candidatus Kapabacteria bacterium]